MKPATLRFVLTLICLTFPGFIARTSAAPALEPTEVHAFLQKLAPTGPAGAVVPGIKDEAPRISMTPQGFVRSIGAPPGKHFPPEPGLVGKPADAIARSFMLKEARMFGLANPNAGYLTKRSRPGDGRHYVRLQQTHRNLPVVAAESVVQVNQMGGVESVLNDLSADVPDFDARLTSESAVLTASEAVIRAKAAFPAESPSKIEATPPQLAIFAPSVLDEPGDPTLVWDFKVSCDTLHEANARVLVDAVNGQILRAWTTVHPALNRQIFDANSTTNNPGTLTRAEGQAASGIVDVDNAYRFLGDTYNFYLATHGRDSLDGNGFALQATVRYCQPNGTNPPSCPPPGIAFFSDSRKAMYFGIGTVTDDITAHELTHGVTGFESDLIYTNASGAINESLSDVWGEFVDLSNTGGNDSASVRWDMGEDLPGGRIRSMSFPTNFSDPDSLFSTFYQPPSNTNDFGGVHRNSGVNNKLCYLLTDGDTFNGETVAALGITRVARLYYEAQVNLLTSGAGWVELYNALTQAAVNLGWSNADRNNLYHACLAVEIASAARNLFVDKSSTCPIPAGNPTCVVNVGPYRTVGQGVSGASPGDLLNIRAGSYSEAFTTDKILTLKSVNGPVTIGQ